MSEKILIGKIVAAVGIKGEVKIYNYSEQGRYARLKTILVESKTGFEEFTVTKSRDAGNTAIVALKGVVDRNMAEAMRERKVYILETQLEKLPEDTYYIRDLVGCKVYDEASESEIGEITDVLQNSAQDNYEITTRDGKVFLLPSVKEFVKSVDVANKMVKVSLIEGFIDGGVEA